MRQTRRDVSPREAVSWPRENIMVDDNGSQILTRSWLADSPNTGTGETHFETTNGQRWHTTQPFERADGVIVDGRIVPYVTRRRT